MPDGLGLDRLLVLLACQGRGSITSLVSETGGGGARGLFLAERYRYDSFGQLTVTDPAGTPRALSAFGNPYFFTGREFDFESGLYYNRHRSWDPHTGRFLQEDSVGVAFAEQNLYPYVRNNPLGYVDPLGLQGILATTQIPMGPMSANTLVAQEVGDVFAQTKITGRTIIKTIKEIFIALVLIIFGEDDPRKKKPEPYRGGRPKAEQVIDESKESKQNCPEGGMK